MRSKAIQRLLRVLLALLGAGTGLAITLGAVQLYRMTRPEQTVPLALLLTCFIGMAVLCAALFFFFGKRVIIRCLELMGDLIARFDRMPVSLLVSSVLGMIVGLIVASLLIQILQFMGDSMFTTVSAAIMYLVLGVIGYTIGWRRSADLVRFFMHLSGYRSHRFTRKGGQTLRQEAPLPAKLLDTSALIDGRILDICRLGFAEGELVVPEFVLAELRHIADSADPLRRAKGRRGLDLLQRMQQELKQPIRVDETTYADTDDVDVMLLRLARRLNGTIVTGDHNLNKAAAVTGVRVMNVNELAGALRPMVRAGDELTLTVTREGKEPGQGVAYMDDGTMVVIDGGRAHMGETIPLIVTSALQTNAGRMIFAKLRDHA